LEQGRDVFAVPGQINSPLSEGANYLLKQGAKLVTKVEDVMEGLGYEVEEGRQIGIKVDRLKVHGRRRKSKKSLIYW